MIITVVETYTAGAETDIELPEGYTFDDIEHTGIKWGQISIMFKDGTGITEELNPPELDTKRPEDYDILPEGDIPENF